MSLGISRELISGDAAQAAEKIAEVAVVARPIRQIRKQAGVWDSIKDFASDAWARDDVKWTLGGAGIGAGVGGATHLVGGGDMDMDFLGSALTGGLAGGGVGYGAHALKELLSDSSLDSEYLPEGIDRINDDGDYEWTDVDGTVLSVTKEQHREFIENEGNRFETDPDAIQYFENKARDAIGLNLVTLPAVGGSLTRENLAKLRSKIPMKVTGDNLKDTVVRAFKSDSGVVHGFIGDQDKLILAIDQTKPSELRNIVDNIKNQNLVYSLDETGKLVATATQTPTQWKLINKATPTKWNDPRTWTRPGRVPVGDPIKYPRTGTGILGIPTKIEPRNLNAIDRKFLKDLSKNPKIKGRFSGKGGIAGLIAAITYNLMYSSDLTDEARSSLEKYKARLAALQGQP